jgi:hypothetical protein
VSPYSIDTAAWGISPSNRYVSSMYQLQVMIVEATVRMRDPAYCTSNCLFIRA